MSTAQDTDPTPALAAIGALNLGAQRAALVRAALSSGLLERWAGSQGAEPSSEVSGAGARVDGLLRSALVEAGVLSRDEVGAYQLTATYASLLGSGNGGWATSGAQAVAVRERILGGLFAGTSTSYADLSEADRAVLAESVTVDPTTAFGVRAMTAMVQAVPAWQEQFRAGARHLHLGCGVSGSLLAWLQSYPKVTAVGLDLADDLLDIARSRAEVLKVEGRVRFVTGDASRYSDPQPFDTAFWSQLFFPRRTRGAALENALKHLRPGGLLAATALAPSGPLGEKSLYDALIVESWDVPALTAEELAAEITAAGFVDAAVIGPTPLATVVLARRP